MEEVNQFVVFKVGTEEYAIPILKVNEIIRLKGVNITEIPNTYNYIIGIINLRGEVIPIMDIRLRFNIEPKPIDDNSRIIIVNLQNKAVGFLVDSVSEVANVDSEDITDPPEEISDIDNRYITGIAKYKDRILVILNIDMIITL